MADNMEDLLAGLDIEGLDDVDDISGDKLQKLVDNIEITYSGEEQDYEPVETNVSRGSAADFKKNASSALMEDDLDEIDDDEIEDVEIEDVDALLKQAFLDDDDDDIDEDNVEMAIDAALFNVDNDDESVDVDNNDSNNEIENISKKDDDIKKSTVQKEMSSEDNSKGDLNLDKNSKTESVSTNQDVIIQDDNTDELSNKKSLEEGVVEEPVTSDEDTKNEKGVKKDKSKKKKGFIKFKKPKTEKDIQEEANDENNNSDKVSLKSKMTDMAEKLFYNIPDAKYDEQLYREEEIAVHKKENQKEKKAKRAEAKKQAQEEAKAKRQEEKEKEKAKKDELKKKKTAQKKAAKEKRKAEEAEALAREPIGRINKLGAAVVTMFVGVICMFIILFANGLRESIDFEKEAEILMNQGKYEMAYIKLLMDPELDKESRLYRQLHVIQGLNKQISYYSSAYALHDREEALHALIVGITKYDNDKKTAKNLAIAKEYNDVYKEIAALLKSEYELTVKEARELSYINSNEEYSERIVTICEETKK